MLARSGLLENGIDLVDVKSVADITEFASDHNIISDLHRLNLVPRKGDQHIPYPVSRTTAFHGKG